MTRTVALGYVSEEMDKVYNTVLEGTAGRHRRDEGGRDRYRRWTPRPARSSTDAGYGDYFGHGYGHSLGIAHPRGARTPTPRNDKPMPAGAVVSAEPGIYLPGKFGVRIEDVTVITEDRLRDPDEESEKFDYFVRYPLEKHDHYVVKSYTLLHIVVGSTVHILEET